MGERESKREIELGREDGRKQRCSPPKTGTYKKKRPVNIRKAQSENAILTLRISEAKKRSPITLLHISHTGFINGKSDPTQNPGYLTSSAE